MATLTTVDGIQISFSPKSVGALTDHDAATGQAVTCVYGVRKAMLKIAETPPAFIARLGLASKFIQLTRANGAPVWISAPSVSSIRPPLPNEYVAGVDTVVFTSDLTQGVKETPAAVTKALGAHGGEV